MPHRTEFLQELAKETTYGVLLLAQMGGVPNEIQLMVETAEYDPAVEGLRPKQGYIIRALGVREQQVQLGIFSELAFVNEHPLLLHHNTARTAVHFVGKPTNVSELILDIFQVYVSAFQNWRNLTQMPDDLNVSMPLVDLLAQGYGLLGIMPKPFAERIGRVLEHHGVKATLSPEGNYEEMDDHGRSKAAQALIIDQGYVVALDFSVERVGKVSKAQT